MDTVTSRDGGQADIGLLGCTSTSNKGGQRKGTPAGKNDDRARQLKGSVTGPHNVQNLRGDWGECHSVDMDIDIHVRAKVTKISPPHRLRSQKPGRTKYSEASDVHADELTKPAAEALVNGKNPQSLGDSDGVRCPGN